MTLRTGDEFKRSLQDNRTVFYGSEPVDDVTTHEALALSVEHAAQEFDDQFDHPSLVCSVGNRAYSSYFESLDSRESLAQRRELIEESTHRHDGIFNCIRAIGSDGILALLSVADDIDETHDTDYKARITAYLAEVRGDDLGVSVAMTDVKGDRSRRPAEQAPEGYLRVVDQREDGVVVRGAKAHTSFGPISNEVLVLPTRNLRSDEGPYATAFAVPADAEGLSFICRPARRSQFPSEDFPLSGRRDEMEAITVFDDVFVPSDRVFLNGETEFAGDIVMNFTTYHRFTATVYKPPLIDLFIGAAKLAAEANGLDDDRIIEDKITTLISYAETTRALSNAAVFTCEFRNGQAMPNPMPVNAGKYYFASRFHEMVKTVQDIAGGLAITLPEQASFDDDEVGAQLERHLAGGEGWDGRDRAKLFTLIRDLTASEFSSWEEVLSLHAEGSLQSQRLMMAMLYDTDQATSRVRSLLELG